MKVCLLTGEAFLAFVMLVCYIPVAGIWGSPAAVTDCFPGFSQFRRSSTRAGWALPQQGGVGRDRLLHTLKSFLWIYHHTERHHICSCDISTCVLTMNSAFLHQKIKINSAPVWLSPSFSFPLVSPPLFFVFQPWSLFPARKKKLLRWHPVQLQLLSAIFQTIKTQMFNQSNKWL